MAVAYTDLPNGIVIFAACCIAVPFVVFSAGGWSHAATALPPRTSSGSRRTSGATRSSRPWATVSRPCFSCWGSSPMYQKFYSAGPEGGQEGGGDLDRRHDHRRDGGGRHRHLRLLLPAGGNLPWDPRSMVLQAARWMTPWPVGVLLLGAACAVVLSTGMNYLLSPSTNVIRDIYQRFIIPAPRSGAWWRSRRWWWWPSGCAPS